MAGDYKITATFAGDDSYGSSFATTYSSIGQAPVVTPTATSAPLATNPPYEMYTLGMGLAVIIVVIAVGLLLLKKRA